MVDAAAEEALGDRLKALREGAGKSQEQVAQAIEVNSGTYSRWERNVSMPHAQEIVKLSRYFGCTTDYLLLGGPSAPQQMPRELHRFLATKWGRYAHKRNLVGLLREIRVMPDGHAPTVKSYTRITKTFLLEDDEFDDDVDEDPPKSAH